MRWRLTQAHAQEVAQGVAQLFAAARSIRIVITPKGYITHTITFFVLDDNN